MKNNVLDYNNAFIPSIAALIMSFEDKVKAGFGKAKEDVEGVKNELAFALKRIAKLEEVLTKMAIQNPNLIHPKKKKKR